MPIYMPNDTRQALGEDAAKCESRSLFMDRFADPSAKDGAKATPRKDWFQKAVDKPAVRNRLDSWHAFVAASGVKQEDVLYAQLQSRLMVNMAGGVMENAGLCLDRFGMPYIPGSAVKGCARRAALAALREWCESHHKPSGKDNLFTEACEPFSTPAEMLAAIALVFGWGEQDWNDRIRDGHFVSDFAYACDKHWATTSQHACDLLVRAHRESTFPKNFAGSVSFLPAYPIDLGTTGQQKGLPLPVPQPGKLDLDIVTCHHTEYYSSNDPNAVATDTEEPNPVIFPAVSAGHIFLFVILPTRHSLLGQVIASPDTCLTALARTWLKCGLATFGLGTKTGAGYGWFSTSNDVQMACIRTLETLEQRKLEEKQRAAELRQEKEAEEKRRRENEEIAKATAGMSAEQKLAYEMTRWPEDKFENKIQKWNNLSSEEKAAAYQLLRDQRQSTWQKIKMLAQQGKKKEKRRWSPTVHELYKMAKERKEKMP